MIDIGDLKRPNPDYLLSQIEKEEEKFKKGKLKIFFGFAAGVGKTYAMLEQAHDMIAAGLHVMIGYIEPHARPETSDLVNEIESIPPQNIEYNGIMLHELDLDKALQERPDIILVDELAHTNANGKRHRKRWQDVEELLDAGIDVYTTLNVQHIESLNDVVASITHVFVRETIPDRVFDEADKVELIDIEPDELLKRFLDGKIYSKQQTKKAFHNFFTSNNLYALREIALRRTADRVNNEVECVRLSKGQITVMPTSDQILACISSSPSSLRVIRTAARMAEVYHSKWIAVYVGDRNSKNLSNDDKERLNTNFNLVSQLGGETATINGENVAEQIIDYAKFRNITKIVIGKNNKESSKFFHFYARDVVNKLMDSNSYIDVYVIPSTLTKKKGKSIVPKINNKANISFKEVFKATAIMIFTLLITIILNRFGFADADLIMVLIIGVIIVYITTKGYMIGIISSVAGMLFFNYFFTEPKYSFQFYDKSYIATFPMMLVVSLVIGTLTNKIQREAENSSIREKQTQILYRVSKKLLSARETTDVVTIGIKYISRLINRTVVCYIINEDKLSTPFIYKLNKEDKESVLLSKNEEAVAYWTFINDKESGSGTNTFYGAKGFYRPIKGQNKILGVIGVSCSEGFLEPEQKFIFETVTSQIAISMEREILSKKQELSKIEIERERLRSNLLRSISHDLRSPLAGIKGAASTLIENGENIPEDTKKNLVLGIYDDTEWLIRLVENLLSMTRFDEGRMEVKKDMELVEEVVTEAVQRSGKYYKNHRIKVILPENIIIAPMDGNLIEQVIINLIDNAAKFSPKDSLIIVKIYEKDNNVYFEIIDNGMGISEEILPNIFDRFFTNGSNVSDSRRGVGLGLAICKSIVEAHKGTIQAFNRKEAGAIFKFNVPMAAI